MNITVTCPHCTHTHGVDLPTPEPQTRVRRSDGDTAREAANRLNRATLNMLQGRVLALLHPKRGQTQPEIIAAYRMKHPGRIAESSIRTRLSELRALGLASNESKIPAPSGRKGWYRLWQLTPLGVDVASGKPLSSRTEPSSN